MTKIYWFKDRGLFTGNPRDIGCTSDIELLHRCDAAIDGQKIIKNRYGTRIHISIEEVRALYAYTLDEQYEFFKGTDVIQTR